MNNVSSAPADDPELGSTLAPRFSSEGLITAIATDAISGAILMVAHMNAEAFRLTIETGTAHYYSRSRRKLWKKGETSGELQRVEAVLLDCDQDAVVMKVHVEGRGSACHNGFRSCFYRQVTGLGGPLADARLDTVDTPLVAPESLYGKP